MSLEITSQTPSQTTAPPAAAPHLSHVRELDGIRGLAALAVFCHHLLFATIPHPEQWNALVVSLAFLSRAGAYGVDIFFVLSGFLITSILLLDRPRPHFYWNFYWKRTLRIFPLYIVSLVCLAAFFPSSRRYVVLSALFLANFAQVFHIESNGPYWTLAIEEQFYLIWPQFARRFTVAALERLALATAIACLLLRLVAAAFGHHDFRFTFFHLDGLALGAVLACQQFQNRTGSAASHRPAGSNSPAGLNAQAVRSRRRSLWLAALGAILALLPLVASPMHRPGMAAEALQITGISLLGYCLVRTAVRNPNAPGLALFRAPILTFFGLISYCLYMAHLYVLRLYDHLFGLPPIGNMALYLLRFVAVLAATVVLCLISRYIIELPAMSLRRYVLRKG